MTLASSRMTVIFANSPGWTCGSGPSLIQDWEPMPASVPRPGMCGKRMSTTFTMRNSVVNSDRRR